MTSLNAPEDLAMCRELGVCAFLSKPLTFSSFSKAFADTFQATRLQYVRDNTPSQSIERTDGDIPREVTIYLEDFLQRNKLTTLADLELLFPEYSRIEVYLSLMKIERTGRAKSELRDGGQIWFWVEPVLDGQNDGFLSNATQAHEERV